MRDVAKATLDEGKGGGMVMVIQQNLGIER